MHRPVFYGFIKKVAYFFIFSHLGIKSRNKGENITPVLYILFHMGFLKIPQNYIKNEENTTYS